MKYLLKNTVRNECGRYQAKIDQLQELAEKLKFENETLRQHVDEDLLQQFQQQQQKQQQQQEQQQHEQDMQQVKLLFIESRNCDQGTVEFQTADKIYRDYIKRLSMF